MKRSSTATLFAIATAIFAASAAHAQSRLSFDREGGGFNNGGGPGSTPPPVHHHLPPQPVFTPPGSTTPPPRVFTPPVVPVVTPPQTTSTDPFSKDVTSLDMMPSAPLDQSSQLATNGIQTINDPLAFENKDKDNDPNWILVRGDDGTKFEKPTPTTVKLTQGTILVAVRHPSKGALIQTPDGLISLQSDGDLLISYVGGVLRVDNISCRGTRCKIKLLSSVIGDGKTEQIALAPGYEMSAGDHKLLRGEVRPADGIARRAFKLLANGHVAVSEFSVESVLSSSTIIASMNAESNAKGQRVLHDMCKMAAVLNCVNGSTGYTTAAPTGVASSPNNSTH